VNQPSFAVGETLVASVSVDNGGTSAATADIYLGLLFPDESAVFFTSLALTPTSGYALGNALDFASYRPIAAEVPLGAPFAVSLQPFLSYQRRDVDPAGGFALFLLVTTSGALADGILEAPELLAASLTPFTFPAAAGGGAPCVGVCKQ
jgi:hypothetical protein